uniref:RBR-type E3 ubiquitin transferase n=1 Tax=Astatotilapia calliptera TaxID=8154 RepID=A0A3P8PPP4_ASTCA
RPGEEPSLSFRKLININTHFSSHQVLESLNRFIKALSILEKYGCNLTSPTRPRYWRSVKHNNPVFRTTVDAIKGGRRVLYLYGYTNQQVDGLSFPDEVEDPDTEKVAAVTLEVMTLRTEVDMIVKVCTRSAAVSGCSLCGGDASLFCSSCDNPHFCDACDDLFHRHPNRASHKRDKLQQTKQSRPSYICKTKVKPRLCLFFAAYCFNSSSFSCRHLHHLWNFCCPCSLRHMPPEVVSEVRQAWQCKSCTVMNQGSSILCEVCERPRLATRPPVSSDMSILRSLSDAKQWTCQFCTFANTKASTVCEMCNMSPKDSGGLSLPQSLQQTPCGPKDRPQPKPRVNLELKRQKTMKEDGLALVRHIREAEQRGISPEEVYAALGACGGSNVNPCDWLTSELPHLLDEICSEKSGPTSIGDSMKLSRAEAKLAWLKTGGETDKAVRELLRDRKEKMKELHSLGFQDVAQCEEALRQSGGEMQGALSLLQRPLLEAFHQRIWTAQPEPPIDPAHPDKQRTCRRLLALYDLPSWGRCELVLSLLQEPGVSYSLEDVVQAVKESHDRDFIRRLLNNECPICLSIFPRSKMQSLTSCQCSVCLECFKAHFTIAVRDKHIRDMVCPSCCEPDINDPEKLDSYFSTLDIQLRDCLEPEVYDLFHKKLTEHALMKDPKFMWCCHCTSGFINEGDQLKVTCLSCHKSFCAQCKKPWEPQHQDVSCEQFQLWKRENDPEYQRQGLAGYLRDNGITCPHCRFQYALTKGGCMHFSCSQCRYQFCSGCNNPYHKTKCKPDCSLNCLHAHHPRDCLFYLRDWEPPRLQAFLQVRHECGVMEQKDEGGQQVDSPCGIKTQPGQAGLCDKHYREYLVSLINAHSLDPALIYDLNEVIRACERYQVDVQRGEGEEDNAYQARLLKVGRR